MIVKCETLPNSGCHFLTLTDTLGRIYASIAVRGTLTDRHVRQLQQQHKIYQPTQRMLVFGRLQ